MFTSTSYLPETSNKVAETYILASKVKTKLTKEAVKTDINLVKLVTQANLLDKLIENINHLQSKEINSYPSPKFTFESINENMYPLLATVNKNSSNLHISQDLEDDEDDNVQIETNTIYAGDGTGSDDSDFDSDYSSDSDSDDDYLSRRDDDDETFNNPLHACVSHDALCQSLEKLNFYQSIVEETDPSTWNNTYFYKDEQEITCEIVSDSESESSTFSCDEIDSDSVETANTSETWIHADIEEQDLADLSTLPQLSKINSLSQNSQPDSNIDKTNKQKTENSPLANIFNKMYSAKDKFCLSKSC